MDGTSSTSSSTPASTPNDNPTQASDGSTMPTLRVARADRN
jgi:hypothetical protein